MSVFLSRAPEHFVALLDPLPPDVRFTKRAGRNSDMAHLFVTRRSELIKQVALLRTLLRPQVPVWVSWPKKSSGVPTDITEDTIREVTLPIGFVDIKVCAVDQIWSGLKLVVRKELR